jgi:hypothetical protein
MSKSKVLQAEMDNVRLLRPGDVLFRFDENNKIYFSGLVLETIAHENWQSIFSFLVFYRRVIRADENTIRRIPVMYDKSRMEIFQGDFND